MIMNNIRERLIVFATGLHAGFGQIRAHTHYNLILD
jgi:hypothetical protein